MPHEVYHQLPNEDEIIQHDFELFGWDTAIENFQASIDERKKYPMFKQRAVRVLAGRKSLLAIHHRDGDSDEIDWNILPTLVSQHAELIPVVAEIRRTIELKHAIKKPNRVNCHMFISLASNSDSFEWHNDTEDTYIWQVKGKTKWYLGDDETILEPNDMIYIPIGKYHKPEIIEPRISVSFSVERVVE